jgi:hypothetical protein
MLNVKTPSVVIFPESVGIKPTLCAIFNVYVALAPEAFETIEILFCPVANVNEIDDPLATATSATVIVLPAPVGVIDSEAVLGARSRV